MAVVTEEAVGTRPRLRGRLHQVAFIVSVPSGVALVALGRTGLARVAVAVYAVCVTALFGVSASYHRLSWSPPARALMRRLDHSTIFLLIAGTYTPFSLLALRGPWRVSILATVWGVALLGIVLQMFHLDKMRHAGMVLYLALGWTAVVALPAVLSRMHVAPILLLFGGGLSYTAGAIMFALHRPDPNPRVFGYHEVWHSFVIAGWACHYAMILLLAIAAR